MTDPYADHSIIIEVETGTSERLLRFKPDRPEGTFWLHRLSEFDRTLDRNAVIDRYALPPSDEYEIQLVTVPPGESMQIGDVAGTDDRSGGGDLVELLEHDSIPSDWIDETATLKTILE
ncbi:hypothetical protein [Natrinema limicola]|uniref:Uncharacterized protein n=1 Tax=Natrinema limicola JCM 13563 TaxID=1230457 RepID=M0C7V2_9EURY|nr:hypothetical protein [Natrinema limicola]ELZ19320.1 hypothetical protein C476_12701 [Natrinema limicola JCM 13563]